MQDTSYSIYQIPTNNLKPNTMAKTTKTAPKNRATTPVEDIANTAPVIVSLTDRLNIEDSKTLEELLKRLRDTGEPEGTCVNCKTEQIFNILEGSSQCDVNDIMEEVRVKLRREREDMATSLRRELRDVEMYMNY
jgi:hypothetical protein